MEKNCGNSPHCSETVDRSQKYFNSSPSLLQVEEDFLLSQPTSSQQNSKTLLKKDLIELQNNFFEDEETTSSAVLDAFEISSSNSILTNDTGSVEVVEENSSTNTSSGKIDLDVNLQTKCINESRVFIVKNETNDDQTEVNKNPQHNVCENEVLNDIITTLCSKKVILEAPVSEQHQENDNDKMLVECVTESYDKSQKNSNKSNNEFVLKEEDSMQSSYGREKTTNNVCKSKLNILNMNRNESMSSLYSDNSELNCIERTAESQNDMSLSLKKMSLGSSTVCDTNPENRSSLLESKDIVSQNYIKPSGVVERNENMNESADESTVNSSLSTNNLASLGLVQSCVMHFKSQVDAIDNVPSSSNNKNRTISSKIKDLLSNPKSNRHSNQTKPVTAKLNLYHNINYNSFKDDIALGFNSKKSTEKSSKLQNIQSAVKSEICSSTYYNDTLVSIDAQNSKIPFESKHEHAIEQGCSRTTALQPQPLADENEILSLDISKETKPSTSSKCHNSINSRLVRQTPNTSSQNSDRNASRFSLINANTSATTNSNNNINIFFSDNSENLNTLGVEEKTDMLKISKLGKLSSFSSSTNCKNVEFNESTWVDCDETNSSDLEEICTCQYNVASKSHSSSNTSLNEIDELNSEKNKEIDHSLEVSSEIRSECHGNPPILFGLHQRKRKFNETHSVDSECFEKRFNTFNNDIKSRKRVAYDCVTSHCPLQTEGTLPSNFSICITAGRRTPRSVIPTRDNPPPELQNWLAQFQHWSNAERLLAVDCLIDHCNPTQVRHMMKIIEPQFQRDFISLLPRELALSVLSYLAPKDLLRAAQTCRSWRFLCDDNLLWKEKCRKAQIITEPRFDRPTRGRAGTMPTIASPWKAAYMRQHIIEMNWRSRPIREPKVLKGHDDHVITCLQFSGNRIVSGSDDNTLKVWSAVTGRCLRTLIGHTGGVWSSQMSGNIIISGSTDRTLKVWDMETGQCIHTLLGHTSTVRCMHLHGNKVVSGSRDATLRVWDIQQGNCLHVLIGHLAAVRCVQYDGKLIVSGAYDYMVKIWHPERQECLHTLQGHTNRVYSLQFDGSHVVSGSLDTSIRVWDVETGSCKHTLMGHQSLTSGMELRQNILVSGNADSTVKVWDITTGQCLQTLSGPHKHQSAVTCLQFNSRFVVTSSDDGTVKLWDVKTGEFIRNLVSLDSGGSGGVVWRIRANDTKLICAVGSRNGTEETKLMVLDFDVEGACVKCS